MADNNQDRSQDQGQQGIDRETEQRNRENEAGQTQNQQSGQQGQADTTLSERTGQTGGEAPTGQSPSTESGFVGSEGDKSSDYLTKGEEKKDFTAQDTSAGRSDVETGQAQDNQSSTDDGSDTSR